MKLVRMLAVLVFAVVSANPAPSQQLSAQEPRILIVVAKVKDLEANHYLWAAEIAAGRLQGKNNQVLEGGLAAAIKEAREHPGTVRGIVEIVVNVYAFDEDVRISCFDAKGKQLWKKKSSVNAGGSEEELARNLFERTLEKAEKMPACGR